MVLSLLAAVTALTTSAFAVDLPESQQLALEALQMEFVRAGVTETDDVLAERFQVACDRGYPLACKRRSWSSAGLPDLQRIVPHVEKPCENGDPVACLAQAWALDAAAPDTDAPDRTWRRAARLLKIHCDQGFAPACHDYGFFLQENKGLTADPRAAALRWRSACDGGFLPSCTTLGSQQLEGAPGVPRARAEGLALLGETCEAGDPQACHVWGKAEEAGWPEEKRHAFFTDLCDRGHRQACWDLGVRYANGSLEAPAEDAAPSLLRRGCALGHAGACFEAGQLATAAQHPDYDNAAQLLERGCQLGESDACSELVELFLEERVVGEVKTHRRAYESACTEEEHLTACTHLATALIRGVDLPRDPYRARELLQRSCVDANSAPEACVELGRAFEEGTGGDRDRTVAARYYQWACYADRFDACDRRGDLLLAGVGIRRDDHEALAMFDRACQGGIWSACHKAATILDDATYVVRDVARSAELYQTACDNGIASGCAGLGRLREEGIEGAPDFKGAREAYSRGIGLDDVECRRRLARLLHNGLGGKRERRRAKVLAKEACQNGDPVACRGPAFL